MCEEFSGTEGQGKPYFNDLYLNPCPKSTPMCLPVDSKASFSHSETLCFHETVNSLVMSLASQILLSCRSKLAIKGISNSFHANK